MNMNDDWRAKLMRASGFSSDELARAAAEAAEDAAPATGTEPGDGNGGVLHIFVEKKGRAGKTATIVTGFRCSDARLRQIASDLKNGLGCGGSCRDGEILVQGDRRDEAARRLRQMGYNVK